MTAKIRTCRLATKTVLACGLVSHARFAFLLNTITFQKFSWFSWFDSKVMDSKTMWHLCMACIMASLIQMSLFVT